MNIPDRSICPIPIEPEKKVHVFKNSFTSLDIHMTIKPMFSAFPKGL